MGGLYLTLRALVAFVVILSAFIFLSPKLMEIEALHVKYLMGLLGLRVVAVSRSLITPNHNPVTITITVECSGCLTASLLLALILAPPKVSVKDRAWGCVKGLALIYLANVLRICMIIAFYRLWGERALHFAHRVLGGIVMFSVTIGYWALWAKDKLLRA